MENHLSFIKTFDVALLFEWAQYIVLNIEPFWSYLVQLAFLILMKFFIQ